MTARYSMLELNRRVFTAGFADPNLWTNHTQMVDVGFNWYLNKSVKIYFDWEHAIFGSPWSTTPRPGASGQERPVLVPVPILLLISSVAPTAAELTLGIAS